MKIGVHHPCLRPKLCTTRLRQLPRKFSAATPRFLVDASATARRATSNHQRIYSGACVKPLQTRKYTIFTNALSACWQIHWVRELTGSCDHIAGFQWNLAKKIQPFLVSRHILSGVPMKLVHFFQLVFLCPVTDVHSADMY